MNHSTKVVTYNRGVGVNFYGQKVANVTARWECTCGKHGRELQYTRQAEVRKSARLHRSH